MFFEYKSVLHTVLISDDDDDVTENPLVGSVPSSKPPPHRAKKLNTHILHIIHIHASNDNHIL